MSEGLPDAVALDVSFKRARGRKRCPACNEKKKVLGPWRHCNRKTCMAKKVMNRSDAVGTFSSNLKRRSVSSGQLFISGPQEHFSSFGTLCLAVLGYTDLVSNFNIEFAESVLLQYPEGIFILPLNISFW